MDYKLHSKDAEKARMFYESIRKHDARLLDVQKEFCEFIEKEVELAPINNGSFGLLLNLDTSDIDLTIGADGQHRKDVSSILSRLGSYIDTRQSTPDSDRDVFLFHRDGIDIDVGVLTVRDWEWTKQGMEACRSGMTDDDRIEHVWIKDTLKNRGAEAMAEYKDYKLKPYRDYFPGTFIFTPIYAPDTPKVYLGNDSPEGMY